jgi:hypothetical protein
MTMAKTRPGVVVDSSEVQEMTGFIVGLSEKFNSAAYKRDVAKSIHAYYAAEFDREFSALAAAQPGNYHHMFENRMVGRNTPEAKLWRHVLRGQGESQQASWNFLPAKTPILRPKERRARKARMYDPIQDVPMGKWRSFLKYTRGLDYFFPDKAMHLEYNIPQRVSIKEAKALWIPLPGGSVIFQTDFEYTNELRGYDTEAGFTKYWTYFWGQKVPATFKETAGREVEKAVADQINKGIRPRKRSRSYGFNVLADEKMAFEMGRDRAKAMIWYGTGSLKRVRQGAIEYDGIL